MMTNKNILAIGVCIMFSTMLLTRCAHPATPQGGPKDSLPPTVIEALPAYGTTKFEGKKVIITFDEYIQLKDQQKNFYISPLQEKKPSLSLKNKSVVVEFKTPLDSNTTYSLEFGNTIVDNNEGNVLKGLSYVFSTGDYIDSMTVTGFTFDAATLDTLKNTNVFFFAADADSIPERDSTLLKAKVLAAGRSMDNGIFIRENIKPIDYRVYALFDANGNDKYERGTDMVGFLDSTYNPLTLPEFSTWIDTANNRFADPQLFFRLFMEEPMTRHNLSDVIRPVKNRVVLSFSSPFPTIDTLDIEGFDKEDIIVEYLKPTKDSISLWFTGPLAELPDTIRGRLVYHKSDSVGILHATPYDIKLGFFEKVEKEKEPKPDDPPKPNPFALNVEASQSVIPEKHIPITFDYPIYTPDMSKVLLEMIGKGDRKSEVKFSFRQDTMNIRRWILEAKWEPGVKYDMLIPAGTFENIAGESNDTLRASFTVADINKFATVVLNLKNANPEYKYILQIVDLKQKNKILKEVNYAVNGKYTLSYIEPGTIALRVVEDRNGNGKWDTGDLILRLQPEEVRMFIPDGATKAEIVSKANWEVDYDVDLKELFAPRKSVKTHIIVIDPDAENTEVDSTTTDKSVPTVVAKPKVSNKAINAPIKTKINKRDKKKTAETHENEVGEGRKEHDEHEGHNHPAGK